MAQLVRRFNQEGLEALEPRHGGGPQRVYGATERERILAEMRRAPDREADGTASWSLSTLQRAVRRSPDGRPTVSRETLLNTWHDAGWSWCQTGKVLRTRKAGIVEVTEPEPEKKSTD